MYRQKGEKKEKEKRKEGKLKVKLFTRGEGAI